MSSHVDRIEQMVYAAMTSMEAVEGTTAGEVLSAGFTIALRLTEATLLKHPELRDQAKQAGQILLMGCATGSRPN